MPDCMSEETSTFLLFFQNKHLVLEQQDCRKGWVELRHSHSKTFVPEDVSCAKDWLPWELQNCHSVRHALVRLGNRWSRHQTSQPSMQFCRFLFFKIFLLSVFLPVNVCVHRPSCDSRHHQGLPHPNRHRLDICETVAAISKPRLLDL